MRRRLGAVRPRRAAQVLLGSAIALLLPAAVVQAAPVHPPLTGASIGGLNHACGTAVDSKGDIYVSSAGESKVEVLGPSGGLLTSIPNSSEPCGLAVDSAGRLYVSEQSTGEVVRYAPNAYPFAGTPTYGAPTTIDSSGNARGVSVDTTDNSLYVAEGSRVSIYEAGGSLFTGNESQRLRFTGAPSGGTYTLGFEGQTTGALAFNAPPSGGVGPNASIQNALEALSTIGAGNVSVSGVSEPRITFIGALAGKDVPQLSVDPSGLVGGGAEMTTRSQGFDGHMGEGELSDATGVSAYTYSTASGPSRRYISVADASEDEIKVFAGEFEAAKFAPGTLEPLPAIDGASTPAGELGLAATGAYLGVDPANGHIFAYDAAHAVLNEFEATGQYFTQVTSPSFTDGGPTAIAVDRSGGSRDGTLYVTAGSGAGAELLAFEPVAAPSRATLSQEPPSHKFSKACGAVVDSKGDLYVAGESAIRIYGPAGNELGHIEDGGRPCWLAVDSEGNLYATNLGGGGFAEEEVVLYEPNSYPFSGPPKYGPPKQVDGHPGATGIAVDPANDHLFVSYVAGVSTPVHEYDSAAHGSVLLDADFCNATGEGGIDVYGANGDVYIARGAEIEICNASGSKVLRRIDGSGSPGGPLSGTGLVSIAVDQSNGDVLVGTMGTRGVVMEFEASGVFVAQFGPFSKVLVPTDVAIDNSGGPGEGRLYVADLEKLSAFGPLNYGEPPLATTGVASGFGAGGATLNGTVDPRGFELTECRFEYLTDEKYESNGKTFAGASARACAESTTAIGHGTDPVPVHVDLTSSDLGALGPDPSGRYRFRLVAKNKFGESPGEAGLFGPPRVAVGTASQIRYREATLKANLDPAGLRTTYRFEYLPETQYVANGETFAGAQSTPAGALAPATVPAEVEAFLTELAEGTEYRFRAVAENEAGEDSGTGLFTTLAKLPALNCPNATLRLENNSTNLPDCRAYELVTPPDVRGNDLRAQPGMHFDNWMVTPSGSLAGQSLTFYTASSLPGTEGSGLTDAFRATRGPAGWSSELFSPNSVQMSNVNATEPFGVSADQLYSLWQFGGETPPGALPFNHYLRTPSGFEPMGQGSMGTDPNAEGRFVSPGGSHVIFTTEQICGVCPAPVQLESEAPPSPVGAVYDRSPGGPTHVISLPPEGASAQTKNEFKTDDATYKGTTPDGSATVFAVNGALYLRRNDETTVEIAQAPNAFAGITTDGERVFFAGSESKFAHTTLFVCDAGAGSCAGPGAAQPPTEIAPNAEFVNVSADGSRAYFTSEEDLAEGASAGSPNLYLWNGSTIAFVAVLADGDMREGTHVRFPGTADTDTVALDSWTSQCVGVEPGGGEGEAFCPSRTSPDGRFLVFQSHADLTPPYESDGHSEVYRYDANDGSLLCVSCDPSGAPATAEADLQPFEAPSTAQPTTVIPNVTENGSEVFFQTPAALLPEDANSVNDVYEWEAQGAGGCDRASGCLALISSGQSDNPSYLYSMTPNGHDVFFSTVEKLIGSDIAGSASIYDARVEGGFPQETAREPCHGDACQPLPGPAPGPATVTTAVPGSGNAKASCPRGSHSVRRKGKVRCVKRHGHKHRGKSKQRRSR